MREQRDGDAGSEQERGVLGGERGADRETERNPGDRVARDERVAAPEASPRSTRQRRNERGERERPPEQERRVGSREREPELRERHARDDQRGAKPRAIAAQRARNAHEHHRGERAGEHAPEANAERRGAEERGADANDERDRRRMIEISSREVARPLPVVRLIRARAARALPRAGAPRSRSRAPPTPLRRACDVGFVRAHGGER